jgi:hypothetical protein
LAFNISGSFKDLEGKKYKDEKKPGAFISAAQHHIRFILDCAGNKLSNISIVLVQGAKYELLFDNFFLFLVREKGTLSPYIAIWIDNDELLQPVE